MNPIKPNTLFCLLISSLLAVSSFGQKEGALDDLSSKAADLEAQVRKLDASTVEGANVLLELSDLYHENGRAFGMIRTGKTFVKTHKGHPRHKELMLKLLDAYLVTSRNDDIVSTSRQFLEFYGKDAAAPRVARELAVLLNRLGKRDETAKAYEHAWKLAGVKDLNSAFEAVRLYGGNRGAQFARECGRLSEEILDKLPNGSTARELGWYGYNQARYGNWDLKRSVAIGNKLLQRNLITDPKQRGQLHYYLAQDLWNQGQRTNANQHFQKAWETQRDNSSYLEQLINYLGSSSAKAGQILPHVNEYRRRFPENKIQLGTSLSILAHAYSRDKQPAQAVTVAAEALALNPTHNQVGYYYVTWINALDPKRLPEAENVLRQAIPKVKPEHRYAVRYPLAIHLLRDKVKDPNRARGEAFQLLAEDSTGHSWVSTTLNWFLDSATDQASFQRDAERVVKVAEANGNRSYLRSWLSTWSKAAGSTDDAKANKKWLRNRLKAMNANPEIVSWAAFDKADSNNKPKQFPDLANKLNSEEKFVRFHTALGYDYRHYAGEKGKPNSISHYKALAKRFPKDSSHAARWLGSAGNGTAVDRLEAVRHFLQAAPANNYGDWYNAFKAAHENKDDNLLRQVLQYVNKAEDKFGKSFGYITNNANLLLDRNMTAEAKQYLDRHMDIDPNHGGSQLNEARNVVLLSLSKADENAKINLLEARRKQDNDLHGAYASDLAEILFKKKDWKRFAAVLRDARQRQDQRPFRTFSINTSLAGSWASSIRGDKEMEEATKVDLLKAIRDLRAWNYSISAALALLELETGKPKTEMERLRAMRDATLTADNSTHGWNLGLAFAQSALSNDDYVGAATLLTSIQANSSNVPESYLANGRRLLSQAYSRIGGIGLTIDKDSPIAPLMEVVLHLRLGDNELALETYLANVGLFDSNRDEVPLELILFALLHFCSQVREGPRVNKIAVLAGCKGSRKGQKVAVSKRKTGPAPRVKAPTR